MQKTRTQTLYQYLSPLVSNDSKTNTMGGYRFAITLSFCNGCIWVQKLVFGCKKGSVGATPSSACQKRSHKAAFFDIMGTGDENDEARNGTAAGNRDAVHGHVDAAGSFAAEDRRSGGFYAHL